MLDRRDFLVGSLAGLTCTLAPLAAAADVPAQPFKLGVASGDATHSSVVLWTRLAPKPLAANGGMPPAAVEVTWELATDKDLTHVIRRGRTFAIPELAHSVHIELHGLAPGSDYWYRFSVADSTSATGKTRTLPAGAVDQLRFITTSCQNYTHGYFEAYAHMLRDEPHFILHLGDYLYETSFGETFRRHETEVPPTTLDAFRRRHALYKTDPHLQQAHAAVPFYTTIDNHDAIEHNDPQQAALRAAAYQAWYEHMPIRGYTAIGQNRINLTRQINAGDLFQISLIDARQFREQRAICDNNDYPGYGFGNYRERCDAVFARERSMLGDKQERWLSQALQGNNSRWNVLASPGPLQPFAYWHDGKDLRYIGSWDVFPANRQRVVNNLVSAPGHPLVLSGDVHSFWGIDGNLNAGNERLRVTELVSSSVSANWPQPLDQPVRDNLENNLHVRFYDGSRRGYLLHDVTTERWYARARGLVNARQLNSPIDDLARFTLHRGQTGFELDSR